MTREQKINSAIEFIQSSEAYRIHGGKSFNIFSIINKIDDERVNTSMFTWLFDPNSTHGQGLAFLEPLLRKLGVRSYSKFKQVELFKESGTFFNIDIVIRLSNEQSDAGLIIAIENKTHATEGVDQLKKYSRFLSSDKFRKFKVYKVFLTASGNQKQGDSTWTQVAYEFVVKSALEVCSKMSDSTEKEVIGQYLRLLTQKFIYEPWKTFESFEKNTNTRYLLKEYDRNRDEIVSLIKSKSPQDADTIVEILEKLPNRYGFYVESIVNLFHKLKLHYGRSTYFYTSQQKHNLNKVKLWDFVRYSLTPHEPLPLIEITLMPCNAKIKEKQEKLYQYLQKHWKNPFFDRKMKVTASYDPLYKKAVMPNTYSKYSTDQILQSFEEGLKEFITGDMLEFEELLLQYGKSQKKS